MKTFAMKVINFSLSALMPSCLSSVRPNAASGAGLAKLINQPKQFHAICVELTNIQSHQLTVKHLPKLEFKQTNYGSLMKSLETLEMLGWDAGHSGECELLALCGSDSITADTKSVRRKRKACGHSVDFRRISFSSVGGRLW